MIDFSQISIEIIADSISPEGNRITTFCLEYPRIIHSELMTHRLFSRNAMSSRAIPIEKMIKQVRENPAMPVRFGSNQKGMQDKGQEHDGKIKVFVGLDENGDDEFVSFTGRDWWREAAKSASNFAEEFAKAGFHKQIGNRLIEPYQRMKTIVTATDWNNFFWLRVDKAADPTIYNVARAMKQAFDMSVPELLQPGMWHTPYVDHVYVDDKFEGYCVLDEDNKPVMLTIDEARSISSSCCGQVSYRRLDSTKDKALEIFSRLAEGEKVHASPFEHVATPMEHQSQLERTSYMLSLPLKVDQDTVWWEEGVTHVDRNGMFWSANFRGWIQWRQLIPNNAIYG